MPIAALVWALVATLALPAQESAAQAEALWDAARSGDRAKVSALLDAGVDVNARTRYGATALLFAADKGRFDVVRLLVERGADVNAEDTFYRVSAIGMALSNDHHDIARYLLEHGSAGAPMALAAGIRANDTALVRAALAGPDLDAELLETARQAAAGPGRDAAILALVEAAAKARPVEPPKEIEVGADVLATYAGEYRNEAAGASATVSLADGRLTATLTGLPALTLVPIDDGEFATREMADARVRFSGRGGTIEQMAFLRGQDGIGLSRVVAGAPEAAPAAATSSDEAPVDRGAPQPWPAFRGANAAGVADGQGVVADWDVASGRNVRWKTPVPGIANSSPIVWGNRVYVTTAVNSRAGDSFRTGLYGDVAPVEDLSPHAWKIYALDAATGTVVWEREVFAGAPKVKRHPKASQANSTPVTDGRHVVAVFGTIGLVTCYGADGTLLWTKDIGAIDSGWFFDPTYQWGHSSSPVIYEGTVIVQADQQRASFLAAYDLETGREVWRTERDEISTWGTPTIVGGGDRDELVTNGTTIRGYDPKTGRLLWTLGPNSEITVGTPVAGPGLVYVTGGYPPVRPVYAIRLGGSGDLTLAEGASSSDRVAWSNDREGTYIPTPILYRGQLYTCNNNGIVTAYDAATGERIYRARVGGGGAFSASPVAADGRLYFAGEDGDVFVVKAGSTYEELAKIAMGETIVATPAISDGLVVIRTADHVYGIGRPRD